MRWLAHLFRITVMLGALGLGLLALYTQTPPKPLPPLTGVIDRIVIEKSARRLTVFRRGEPLRSYDIALGFAPDGDKKRQGDGRTPEGVFQIDRRNENSAYHLSLGLNYPSADDLVRASLGGYSAGGDIFIHGQPNALFGQSALRGDWTAGCVAVSNAEIEELWRVVPIGTEVEIKP